MMLDPVEQRNADLSNAEKPGTGLPVLAKDSLNFQDSCNYVNRTNRYVIRIGELTNGGEPLVFPEGTEKAGQPIKAFEDGTPENGVVFWNGKDRTWQAVRGNGKETILITDVDSDQAKDLSSKEAELLEGAQVHTLETTKQLLKYAADELGLIDRQNKKAEAVEKEMKPIAGGSINHQQVTKDTVHQAVYIPTGFIFKDGPVEQTYPEGAVLLTDGKYVWGIDKNVFIPNFKRSQEGLEIDLSSLEDEFPIA